MYYHIYVQYFIGEGKNKKCVDCYEKNFQTLDRIKSNYITPFGNGQTIFLSGRIVRPDSLVILRVLQSEKTLDQIIAEKNNAVPRSIIMIYTAEDLLSGHFNELQDITNDIMNGEL